MDSARKVTREALRDSVTASRNLVNDPPGMKKVGEEGHARQTSKQLRTFLHGLRGLPRSHGV